MILARAKYSIVLTIHGQICNVIITVAMVSTLCCQICTIINSDDVMHCWSPDGHANYGNVIIATEVVRDDLNSGMFSKKGNL